MSPFFQAMMCGCPAVMPYCSVFDEIWTDKTPKACPAARILKNGLWMIMVKL